MPTKIVGKGKFKTFSSGKKMSDWYDVKDRKNRGHIRSKTFLGIAEAMAKQWGREKKSFID
jgi:hypothetical protein